MAKSIDELFNYVILEQLNRAKDLLESAKILKYQQQNYATISPEYKVHIEETLHKLYEEYFGSDKDA